jgi:hypothetical protein
LITPRCVTGSPMILPSVSGAMCVTADTASMISRWKSGFGSSCNES